MELRVRETALNTAFIPGERLQAFIPLIWPYNRLQVLHTDEHDELIGLVNQQSDVEEVELMAKTMADVMREEGIKAGIAQGETRAKRENVLKLLTHQFPDVSDTVVEAIHTIQERSRLDTLFDQILTATSFDDIDLNGIES